MTQSEFAGVLGKSRKFRAVLAAACKGPQCSGSAPGKVTLDTRCFSVKIRSVLIFFVPHFFVKTRSALNLPVPHFSQDVQPPPSLGKAVPR
jgi:hypothetical protein